MLTTLPGIYQKFLVYGLSTSQMDIPTNCEQKETVYKPREMHFQQKSKIGLVKWEFETF